MLSLVLAPLLAAFSVAAQEPVVTGHKRFHVERWTVDDGLPVDGLTQVVQTQDSYLWISTFDGLVRFDGQRFTVFDIARVPELGSNRISELSETRDGSLWITSESGRLIRRSPAGHFRLTREGGATTDQLYEDSQGKLWLVSGGQLWHWQAQRWGLFPVDGLTGQVNGIHMDRDGRLWIGTSQGLAVREAEAAPLRWIRSPTNPILSGEVRFEALRFVESADGRLWVGGYRGFAAQPLYWTCALKPQSLLSQGVAEASASRLSIPPDGFDCLEDELYPETALGDVLWLRSLPPTLHRLRRGTYDRLLDGPARAPWWLTRGPTIRRGLDNTTWILQPHALLRADGSSLIEVFTVPESGPEAQILTSFEIDHEGTIWLTTDTAGLIALRPPRLTALTVEDGLGHPITYAVFEDRAGAIWTGGRGDWLSRIDSNGSIETWHELLINDVALTFFEDTDGALLVGAVNGILRFAEGELVPIDDTHSDARAILRTHDGRLLVATRPALFEHPPGPIDARTYAQHVRPVADLPPQGVQVIHQTADGALWLGTSGGGLARGSSQPGLAPLHLWTQADGLPSDQIRAIHEDATGILWLGTVGGGLVRLDPARIDPFPEDAFTTIGVRDGLFDNSLHHILEDDAGWLWISSNRGIFRVRRQQLEAFANGATDRIDSVAYTERDGMRHREANGGSQSAGLRSRDGRLWFPTMGGLAILDPEELTHDLPPAPVHVERLIAGDKEHRTASGQILLSAEERSFRIEYTALSFRAPDRLRFRHILEGYDEDWQDDDDRRVASYTKVPPGHYVFRVTARSSEGVWSPEGAELAIEVQPFVHETRWFRTLVGLATLALIGGAFLARDRRSRARRWQLEQAVADRTRELWREKETVAQQAEQLAELDRMKSDLFANITHEFRTPLTLILGPLTDLGAGRYGPLDDRGQQQAEVAYANAARLLVLIDQLLDISKLEAGRLLVRAGQHDIRTCVDLMVKHFRALADRRGIELEVRSPPHPIPVLFDFEHLEKILSNLLANAFKFTPRGGRVELAVTPGTGERQGWVAVVVRDTGIGLEPAEQQRIFERFYQVESTSQRRFGGTGLGLALVQELVALHRGEIALESHPGEGSTFRVWLRLGFAHLGEDQITDEEEYTLDSQGHFAVAAALAEPTSAHATVQHDLRELRSASLPGTLAEDERPAILVVDDHPELRGYVREHLEPHYRVIEAGDGREGLSCARQALPDLVVSDVMMPEMDGFELCRQLRQDPELDWLPLILLTAKATAEARLEGLGFGADDYLTKPFDVRELLVRIDNLIASRQRLRDRFRAEGASTALAEATRQSDPAATFNPLPQVTQPSLATSADEELLTRIHTAIDDGMADESFDVETLARRVALGRTRLFERIKELTGKSPAQLLMERRLNAAAALLASSAGQVSEVAYAVGFKSAAHFSRQFRKAYQTTPSAYQRGATA